MLYCQFQAKEYQEALDILDGVRHANALFKIESEDVKASETNAESNLPSGPDVNIIFHQFFVSFRLDFNPVVNWENPSKLMLFLFLLSCVNQVECSIHLLRGYLYEALDNRCLAAECFREALKLDVDCYEAFEALIKHQMLTAQEGIICQYFLDIARHCSSSRSY